MHEHDQRRDQLLDSWDANAGGWGRQADRTAETSRAVTRWMLEHSQLQPGMKVLELAAGPGDTGFMAAREIAPTGTLICSDGSEQMLKVAEARAEELSVTNVEFKQLQAEWIDLETASVDVILIKWGLMLLLDPEAAAKECRRVLKPGGRLVISVWDRPEENPWTRLPQDVMQELGHLDPPDPEGPGMFALSAPGRLPALLQDCGFFEVVVEPIDVTRSYASVTAWLGELIDLSSNLRAAWNPLDDAQRRAVRARLTELLGDGLKPDGSVTVAGLCLGAVADA